MIVSVRAAQCIYLSADYCGRALVKLVSREELLREREEKRRKEDERLAKKARAAAEAEAKRRERLERGRIVPGLFFREHADHAGKYSRYDDQGLPTHDAAGEELPKARRKKLAKELDAQRKLHSEYLEQCG
ncbi:MAG: hypothetical protein BJ554DRAFT_362 [Olpidium bornovanus]|uniref:Uncharacterized protein n=1 Tax=Olpidium bornovanus TaxID=278681 RepID=A0A8H7ZTP1_9FUNG|nr:MAG: hypothetical protein BJ554DRAFT_362 [Olpidium bornovanus]